MKENRFRYLLQKYIADSATDEELEEFAVVISFLDDDTLKRELSEVWENSSEAKSLSAEKSGKMFEQILSSSQSIEPTGNPPTFVQRFFRIRYIAVAASILVLLSVGIFFMFNKTAHSAAGEVLVAENVVERQRPVPYVRHLTLPDGSVVVLNVMSSIEYPASFTGHERNVSLSGEAYFDVHTIAKSPLLFTPAM